MIKKNLRMLIIASIVIFVPMLAGVILWDKLPAQIPIHWNGAGEVDDYGSKAFVVFGIPMLMLVFHWLCVWVTACDPKNRDNSKRMTSFVFWLIPIINIFVSALSYSVALGKNVDVGFIAPIFVGALFVAVGNYLPKCRQSRTVGIKLPWTLKSEENWNRTHRLAGWVWVFGGIAIVLSGLLELFWVMIAVLVVMVLVPVIYSIFLYMNGI